MGALKGCDDEKLISLIKEYITNNKGQTFRVFDVAYYIKRKISTPELPLEVGVIAGTIISAINDGLLSEYSIVKSPRTNK